MTVRPRRSSCSASVAPTSYAARPVSNDWAMPERMIAASIGSTDSTAAPSSRPSRSATALLPTPGSPLMMTSTGRGLVLQGPDVVADGGGVGLDRAGGHERQHEDAERDPVHHEHQHRVVHEEAEQP